ncbi:MAG: hypothetical protein ABJN36_14915 [Cyclobacteriaceae bacterium]
MKKIFILPLLMAFGCGSSGPVSVSTAVLDSHTSSLLQAVSFVDENTAWVSGHQATFCRTLDRGKTWKVFTHPSDTLQFRDLHAFSDDQVLLMSAGPGASSRIMLYDHGIRQFQELYVMPHAEGFLNTVEFWDDSNGLAFGDSFNGELFVLQTKNGGQSWKRIDPEKLPAAGEGEGGFAASGTCITTKAGGEAFIGTGANGHSRILHTSDYGESWEELKSPLIKGEIAGIFSIRMAGDMGLIAGGDLNQPDEYTENIGMSTDGGKSWQLSGFPNTKGTLYGSSIIPIGSTYFMAVCGPKGLDYTTTMGEKWVTLDTANYWAVGLHDSGTGYAVGTDGRIIRITLN